MESVSRNSRELQGFLTSSRSSGWWRWITKERFVVAATKQVGYIKWRRGASWPWRWKETLRFGTSRLFHLRQNSFPCGKVSEGSKPLDIGANIFANLQPFDYDFTRNITLSHLLMISSAKWMLILQGACFHTHRLHLSERRNQDELNILERTSVCLWEVNPRKGSLSA